MLHSPAVSNLSTIDRMALRAYLDHNSLPKLQVVRRLIGLGLMHPGPYFSLVAGVREAVERYERERKRVNLLDPGKILRALRCRKGAEAV